MAFPSKRSQQTVHPPRERLRSGDGKSTSGQLETFTVDVSAGEQISAASPAAPTTPVSRTTTASSPNSAAKADQRDMPSATVVRNRPRTTRGPAVVRRTAGKRSRRGLPAWATSLLVHAGLLAGLGLFSFSTISHQFDFSLSLEADPWEEEAQLEMVSLDTLEDLDLVDQSLAPLQPQPLPQLVESEVGLEGPQVQEASLELPFVPSMALGEGMLGMAESVTDALPKEHPLTATFFGTEVEGKRIVYVVDNSGGMRGGELEALVDELLRSVESLRPDQRFYVIFYSDMLYPLFYPHPVDRFVQADDRTKRRLREWLARVEFCLGNVVDDAVEAAASIRPDVVYLLTDGDLDSTRDQRRMSYLLNTRGRRFKIHTFGMGTGELGKAAEKLKLVAEKNRGTFHAVAVTNEFKQRAEATNRPYHNKEPGRVWGLAVGGGWGR